MTATQFSFATRTDTLGIELGPRTVRAVRLEGWREVRTRALEIVWDPERPDDAVGTIREGLGRARRVAIAIRLPLLFAKRVRLPALPLAERRRVLRFEPQRFFPVRLEELVIAVRDDDYVFATREAPLTSWIRAFEALGPVELVEPGPVALARGLAHAGISNGIVLDDDIGRGLGVMDIRDGFVASARRAYGGIPQAAAAVAAVEGGSSRPIYVTPWQADRVREIGVAVPGATFAPFPEAGDVPAPFLASLGAALGVGRTLDDALLPDDLRSRIDGRRRRSFVGAMVACVAAVLLMLVSADTRRARAVRDLTARVAELERRSAPALAQRNELAALEGRARSLTQIEVERSDPLQVLLAVTTRLPEGAYLRSVRANGAEWQIDGYASQAAAVVQVLSQTPSFRDVHFLSATNRVQVGERMHESFSVAFRIAPAP
jgi:type IV pilus assembly protein PilN